MTAVLTPFWLPRGGSRTEEYEDAFHPRRATVRTARRIRFAVADGASESLLSGRWADLLVRTWCVHKRRPAAEVLATAMSEWQREVASYVEDRKRHERPIQWFEEPGLARGAHATLLGVELTTRDAEGGAWTAVAVGDSCLFHVRQGELLSSFPLEKSDEFTSCPTLVSSRPHQLGRLVSAIEHAEGEWKVGDVLFLATDALSAWFLAAAENGAAPWTTLCDFPAETPELFAAWIGEQRGRHELRNDDVTLLRVELAGR